MTVEKFAYLDWLQDGHILRDASCRLNAHTSATFELKRVLTDFADAATGDRRADIPAALPKVAQQIIGEWLGAGEISIAVDKRGLIAIVLSSTNSAGWDTEQRDNLATVVSFLVRSVLGDIMDPVNQDGLTEHEEELHVGALYLEPLPVVAKAGSEASSTENPACRLIELCNENRLETRMEPISGMRPYSTDPLSALAGRPIVKRDHLLSLTGKIRSDWLMNTGSPTLHNRLSLMIAAVGGIFFGTQFAHTFHTALADSVQALIIWLAAATSLTVAVIWIVNQAFFERRHSPVLTSFTAVLLGIFAAVAFFQFPFAAGGLDEMVEQRGERSLWFFLVSFIAVGGLPIYLSAVVLTKRTTLTNWLAAVAANSVAAAWAIILGSQFNSHLYQQRADIQAWLVVLVLLAGTASFFELRRKAKYGQVFGIASLLAALLFATVLGGVYFGFEAIAVTTEGQGIFRPWFQPGFVALMGVVSWILIQQDFFMRRTSIGILSFLATFIVSMAIAIEIPLSADISDGFTTDDSIILSGVLAAITIFTYVVFARRENRVRKYVSEEQLNGRTDRLRFIGVWPTAIIVVSPLVMLAVSWLLFQPYTFDDGLFGKAEKEGIHFGEVWIAAAWAIPVICFGALIKVWSGLGESESLTLLHSIIQRRMKQIEVKISQQKSLLKSTQPEADSPESSVDTEHAAKLLQRSGETVKELQEAARQTFLRRAALLTAAGLAFLQFQPFKELRPSRAPGVDHAGDLSKALHMVLSGGDGPVADRKGSNTDNDNFANLRDGVGEIRQALVTKSELDGEKLKAAIAGLLDRYGTPSANGKAGSENNEKSQMALRVVGGASVDYDLVANSLATAIEKVAASYTHPVNQQDGSKQQAIRIVLPDGHEPAVNLRFDEKSVATFLAEFRNRIVKGRPLPPIPVTVSPVMLDGSQTVNVSVPVVVNTVNAEGKVVGTEKLVFDFSTRKNLSGEPGDGDLGTVIRDAVREAIFEAKDPIRTRVENGVSVNLSEPVSVSLDAIGSDGTRPTGVSENKARSVSVQLLNIVKSALQLWETSGCDSETGSCFPREAQSQTAEPCGDPVASFYFDLGKSRSVKGYTLPDEALCRVVGAGTPDVERWCTQSKQRPLKLGREVSPKKIGDAIVSRSGGARQLHIVGLADNVGSVERNITLATKRARSIRSLLDFPKTVDFEVMAYGRGQEYQLPRSPNEVVGANEESRRVDVRWCDHRPTNEAGPGVETAAANAVPLKVLDTR